MKKHLKWMIPVAVSVLMIVILNGIILFIVSIIFGITIIANNNIRIIS